MSTTTAPTTLPAEFETVLRLTNIFGTDRTHSTTGSGHQIGWTTGTTRFAARTDGTITQVWTASRGARFGALLVDSDSPTFRLTLLIILRRAAGITA